MLSSSKRVRNAWFLGAEYGDVENGKIGRFRVESVEAVEVGSDDVLWLKELGGWVHVTEWFRDSGRGVVTFHLVKHPEKREGVFIRQFSERRQTLIRRRRAPQVSMPVEALHRGDSVFFGGEYLPVTEVEHQGDDAGWLVVVATVLGDEASMFVPDGGAVEVPRIVYELRCLPATIAAGSRVEVRLDAAMASGRVLARDAEKETDGVRWWRVLLDPWSVPAGADDVFSVSESRLYAPSS